MFSLCTILMVVFNALKGDCEYNICHFNISFVVHLCKIINGLPPTKSCLGSNNYDFYTLTNSYTGLFIMYT